jgi:hypothetical protein
MPHPAHLPVSPISWGGQPGCVGFPAGPDSSIGGLPSSRAIAFIRMRMISKSSAACMLTWLLGVIALSINLFLRQEIVRASPRERLSVLGSDLAIRCSEELSRRWCLSPRRSLNADRVRSSRRASETAVRTRGELVEAKTNGLATTPRAIVEPPKIINLIDALKRSLAQDAELEPKKAAASKPTCAKTGPDWRQRALLPTLSGGRARADTAVADTGGIARQSSGRG